MLYTGHWKALHGWPCAHRNTKPNPNPNPDPDLLPYPNPNSKAGRVHGQPCV